MVKRSFFRSMFLIQKGLYSVIFASDEKNSFVDVSSSTTHWAHNRLRWDWENDSLFEASMFSQAWMNPSLTSILILFSLGTRPSSLMLFKSLVGGVQRVVLCSCWSSVCHRGKEKQSIGVPGVTSSESECRGSVHETKGNHELFKMTQWGDKGSFGNIRWVESHDLVRRPDIEYRRDSRALSLVNQNVTVWNWQVVPTGLLV